MSETTLHRMKDAGTDYALRAVEVLYHASEASVLAFGIAVIFMASISLAVASDLICVPFGHAR